MLRAAKEGDIQAANGISAIGIALQDEARFRRRYDAQSEILLQCIIAEADCAQEHG